MFFINLLLIFFDVFTCFQSIVEINFSMVENNKKNYYFI